MKNSVMKLALQLGAIGALSSASCLALAAPDWMSAGHDLTNSRNQPNETKLDKVTVAGLITKWKLAVDGDVTANPAVEANFIYFPDAVGSIYKVDRISGALIWKKSVTALTGAAGDSVRATPAISGDLLIMGNQAGKNVTYFGQPAPTGAKVFAVNKNTGNLVWKTQIDDTIYSMATHSPIIVNGKVIVGTASNEELMAGFVPKAYGWQWQFRGSVSALDVNTGVVQWKTYTVPEGYYGASVWGSTGAADVKRNQVYMASGDNFWAPQSVFDCMNAGGSPANCMSPDNHFDSIIAFDIDTGKINWAQKGLPYDVWNVGCGLNVGGFVIPPNDNCPNPKGPDYDFAQGPILIGDSNGAGDDQIVGAGQKSGMFWAFKAKSGKLAWNTQVAPGGLTGGLQWGSAYDGQRIYVAVANAGPHGTDPQPWTLKDGTTTTAGGWAALDPKKGTILWTTKDPMGSRSEAAVSVANGVVYGCNLDYNPANPSYYAMDAATGAVKWSFVSGGPCGAGPSIVDGMVYWGTGTGRGTGPKWVYGLGLN